MLSCIKKMLEVKDLSYAVLMDRGAVIINVRSPREYTQGHINKYTIV